MTTLHICDHCKQPIDTSRDKYAMPDDDDDDLFVHLSCRTAWEISGARATAVRERIAKRRA